MLSGLLCRAQTEHGLLPFSNKLLLNPSFAGYNKSTSTWSNLQYLSASADIRNYTFSITHDRWSDKLKAGSAWYFYQGLTGNSNTNRTGAGFSLTKPISIREGQFIPSINLSYFVYTKQWFVYVLDGMLDKNIDPYRPPGKSFLRYNLLVPRLGLLWNSPVFDLGISASYSFRHNELEPVTIGNPQFAQTEALPTAQPFHGVIYLSQKMSGKQNGLESQPFKAIPELVVLVSSDLLLSRAGFRLEQVGHLMSLFVQNNFTDNTHGLAGVFGWKTEYINISVTAGGAYDIPSKRPVLFGEFSLGYVVPYHFINEKNPWAPPENSF